MLLARLTAPTFGFVLLLMQAAGAQQGGQPQAGTLKPPAHGTAAPHPTAPAHPPKAAPREAVTELHKTPVVNPKPTPPKHPGHAKPAGAASPPAPAPAAAPEIKPAEPPAASKGSASGLPLPRFAALRADEVNMRSGPGTRYPIEWVYKRRDLPVEIQREFEVWRLVKDQEGVKGWVHQATLTGRRSFVVIGVERTLRRSADDAAASVAELKPGVVGRIRGCPAGAGWCEVQVGDYRGWLKRDGFWGTYDGEAVTP